MLRSFVMELIPLLSIISPMAALTVFVVCMLHFFSGIGDDPEYEKDIKELRHEVLKGQLGQKTFRYIKDNLKVEDLYSVESKRLDDMFKQNMMDNVTYDRMKKALDLTHNEKLVKIHAKHTEK